MTQPEGSTGSDAARHSAFEHLVAVHRARLLAFVRARSGLDDADAEDVVQNVFTRIWRRRRALDLQSIGPAYLRQAAYRDAGDLVAKRRRRLTALDSNPRTEGTPSHDPCSIAITHQLEEALPAALELLSAAERETFLLVAGRGLTYAEAAHIRRSAAKTVENQVSRARKKLRLILAPFRGE